MQAIETGITGAQMQPSYVTLTFRCADQMFSPEKQQILRIIAANLYDSMGSEFRLNIYGTDMDQDDVSHYPLLEFNNDALPNAVKFYQSERIPIIRLNSFSPPQSYAAYAQYICDTIVEKLGAGSTGRASEKVINWDKNNTIHPEKKIKKEAFIEYAKNLFKRNGQMSLKPRRNALRDFRTYCRRDQENIENLTLHAETNRKAAIAYEKSIIFLADDVPSEFKSALENHRRLASSSEYEISRHKSNLDIHRLKEKELKEQIAAEIAAARVGRKGKIEESYDRLYLQVKSKNIESIKLDSAAMFITLPPIILEQNNKTCDKNNGQCVCLTKQKWYLGRVIVKIAPACKSHEPCFGISFTGYSWSYSGAGLFLTPHIRGVGCGGNVCFGSYDQELNAAYMNNDLYRLVMVVRMFLSSVNFHSPLVNIDQMRHMIVPELKENANGKRK